VCTRRDAEPQEEKKSEGETRGEWERRRTGSGKVREYTQSARTTRTAYLDTAVHTHADEVASTHAHGLDDAPVLHHLTRLGAPRRHFRELRLLAGVSFRAVGEQPHAPLRRVPLARQAGVQLLQLLLVVNEVVALHLEVVEVLCGRGEAAREGRRRRRWRAE
jgi:hypothetical protein